MLLRRRQALLAGLLPLVPRVALAEEAPVDAYARWIAGIGPHPTLAASAEWTAYAQTENERWKTTAVRVKAMQDWAARELGPIVPPEAPLFYPFAGPDALSALALFGASRRVVLVGLEPIGSVPVAASGAASPGFFARLGAALADVHRLTFFRTQEMATDFRQDGVLGALVATVARLGRRITAVEPLVGGPGAPGPPRARIEWTTDAGESRRLDYVQADLANGSLARPGNTGVLASVSATAPCVTFLKAAMYLLPDARFSLLRQAILDNSAVVVEDDTGVPFRAFDARWAVRLFGRYETPGAPFEERFQPDLRAAFERRAPPPLPFGLGYHVDPRRSCLLVASKGGG